MPLTTQQRQHLRATAHALKPVVITGNAGLTDAVFAEIDHALTHHALIKIRINANTRQDRKTILQQICEKQQAEFIQLIGHIGIIYRQHAEPLR